MADVGHGATFVLGTTTNFTAVVESMELSLGQRESVETTYLGSGARKTFMPSDLVDSGTLTMTCQFNPHMAVPPIGSAAQTATVTFPMAATATAAATYAISTFLLDAGNVQIVKEDLMRGDLVWKISGTPTHTLGG